MAHYYPKIYAPFARDNSKSKYVNIYKWSKPEFEMLKDINWEWTQKIDGTSVCLQWQGDKMTIDNIKGHTDKSEFNQRTKDYLQTVFCTPIAETIFEDLFGDNNVNVYGEFCSKDMNQNYGHPDGMFYPFDVQNADTGKYWTRDIVHNFADKFGLQEVQTLFQGSILDAVEYVRLTDVTWNKDFKTSWFTRNAQTWRVENPLGKYPIEGLVGRPKIELLNSDGARIICKVKCKDYEPLKV